MKRCPECRRDYYNDSLLYCLDDGNALLEGPAALSGDEPATAMFGVPPLGRDGLEDQGTEVLRGATAYQPPDGRTRNRGVAKLRTARPLIVAIAGTVLLMAIVFGYRYFAPGKEIGSIAVMPFVNESGNAEVEYLSDGMTETLIGSLSQLPNVNVKGRSSVFRYKGKDIDTKTLGSELGVQAILYGRVIQRGDRLTLSLELLDAVTENVIWSDKYDRRSNDLVSLQSEIARDVSSKIRTTLTGSDVAKVTKTYTTDPEAFRLYLKGRFHNAKYNEDGYKKAIEYFKQAIEIDPGYALAYLGIADAYNISADWYLAPRDALPKSNAAARKALELDDTLADAHILLAINAFWHDWDWNAVEQESKRAAELDPSYGAYGMYAMYLAAMRRFDEAIEAQEARLRRRPLEPIVSNDLEWIYLFAGRFDQSIEQTRKTLELDPNFWQAYQIRGMAHERKGQFNEAIAALEKAHSLDPSPSILGYQGYIYAAAGRRSDAERVLEQLRRLATERYVSSYSIAIIYAGLNDKDAAFEWLEKAYNARASAMALLAVDTVFDNLRPDPRFKELLKRMNLPE